MPSSKRDGSEGVRDTPRNKKLAKLQRIVVPRKMKRLDGVWNRAEERDGCC